MPVWASILIALVTLAAGAAFGYFYRRNVTEKKIGRAEATAQELLDKASQKAEAQRKEIMLTAKESMLRERAELDKEIRDRRNELQRTDRRLVQREDALDKKTESLESRERSLEDRQKNIARLESEAQALHDRQQGELERISNLTSEEARDIIMDRVKKEAYHDAAVMLREIESHAKEEADKKARNIVSLAIQKCAADHVAETTVSVVALPNDDMKGRIIGREGRNIRTLETATGVDLIIDDTPEAVIISGFDSVRREVARIALEKLIMDGRIHPARIEEMVEKARKEVDNSIREAGEQAVFETNLHGIHHELVKLLGRMRYRTSYGQNVLKHSIEVSHLAGVMAAELGADVQLAKRAGLLHDIGKAVDHEIEGTHVTIGADLAKKYHESPAVVHCIMAHHNDVERRKRRGRAGTGRRRDIGRTSGRAPRVAGELHQAPRKARGNRQLVRRRRKDLCGAVGPRSAHNSQTRGRRRRGHADTGARDRKAHRARNGIPGPDKGKCDPRNPRGRFCKVA